MKINLHDCQVRFLGSRRHPHQGRNPLGQILGGHRERLPAPARLLQEPNASIGEVRYGRGTPGATVPVGRLAQPDEIARTILFLADDDASFITGATFSINGAKYMA